MDDNMPPSDFGVIFAGHNGVPATTSSDDAENSWELLQASTTNKTKTDESWEEVDYNKLLRKTNQSLRRLSPTPRPTKRASNTTATESGRANLPTSTTTESGRVMTGENRQRRTMPDRYTPEEIQAKLAALRDLPERPPISPFIPTFMTSFMNRQQQTTTTTDTDMTEPSMASSARSASPYRSASPAVSEASTTSSDLRILNQTFWGFVVEYFTSLFRRLFMGEHGHRE